NTGSARVRKVTPGPNGVIDGLVAPTPTPTSPCVDPTPDPVTIAGTAWCREPEEIITLVAGPATGTAIANDIPATGTILVTPRGMAFDSAGNLYVAHVDSSVRKVTAGVGGRVRGLVLPPPSGCAAPTSELVTFGTTLYCRDPGEKI